ncbi:hypothetical protein BJQ90_02563 [Arthrobacter sp. SO3]|nr:hypothetical protein [Arthrobacter sp. SO3]
MIVARWRGGKGPTKRGLRGRRTGSPYVRFPREPVRFRRLRWRRFPRDAQRRTRSGIPASTASLRGAEPMAQRRIVGAAQDRWRSVEPARLRRPRRRFPRDAQRRTRSGIPASTAPLLGAEPMAQRRIVGAASNRPVCGVRGAYSLATRNDARAPAFRRRQRLCGARNPWRSAGSLAQRRTGPAAASAAQIPSRRATTHALRHSGVDSIFAGRGTHGAARGHWRSAG